VEQTYGTKDRGGERNIAASNVALPAVTQHRTLMDLSTLFMEMRGPANRLAIPRSSITLRAHVRREVGEPASEVVDKLASVAAAAMQMWQWWVSSYWDTLETPHHR
jgi:hypothetical protein